MLNVLCTLALTYIAPAAVLLPAATPLRTQGPSPVEAAAIHARFDPSLGSLRAGRVEAPVQLGGSERTALVAAQQHGTSLAALRAGFEPSNDEWKWLAIGAGIVVLIVLL
jgi:hypothetical protein